MIESLLVKECGGSECLLTPSCTAALELACMLVIEPGDEVIMPAWTFPSTANAVILRGGVPVFIDVNNDLNMQVFDIYDAITPKTKAIMPVHYAGVLADMDCINVIASQKGLYVIEDAAQAIGNWKVSGDFGCLSFHYTKNVSCGQGGALIINNPQFVEKAERMAYCGTTKARFNRGETLGYDWLETGSQYIMADPLKPILLDQLERLEEITAKRKEVWQFYQENIEGTERCVNVGNGHIFWVMRDNKWEWLKTARATSHYDALHLTIPGRKYGRAGGIINKATDAMKRLVKYNTGLSLADARAAVEQ